MTKLDLAHLSTRQTTVLQGAKAAKGQDAIEGTVMQFSSLMSVMNEDFALMNAMQREYVPEKSEAPVPKEIREKDLPDDFDISTPIEEEKIDFDLSEIVNNFAEKEEPQKDLVTNEELLSLPEVFSDPVINTYSLQGIDFETPVELPQMEEAVFVATNAIVQNQDLQEALIQRTPIEPVKIEVPDAEIAKLEIVDEVLRAIEAPENFVMEEIELEPQDSIQEDFGLKDLLKRDFLFDDFIVEENVEQDDAVSERVSIFDRDIQAFQKQEKDILGEESVNVVDIVDVHADDLNASAINASISASVSGTTTTTTQPTVVTNSSDVNISNIQEKKDKEELPTMPKNLRHQSHFSEMLENADDAVLEKMSFNSKLLRRLELIINDPAGKLDIEIAQDPIGVHVKAVVPTEVLKSMQGLQQDLQVALYQKGLELGSYEMQEREEGVNNKRSSSTIKDLASGSARENIEEMAIGGILVNQRV